MQHMHCVVLTVVLLSLPAGAVEVAALDEADKMLSLGFQPQLDRLRSLLPCKRNAATLGGEATQPRTRVQVSHAQWAAMHQPFCFISWTQECLRAEDFQYHTASAFP